MTTATPFTCSALQLIDRFANDRQSLRDVLDDFDTQLLADLKAKRVRLGEEFLERPSKDAAQAYVDAVTRERGAEALGALLESEGGPEGISERTLRRPAVFVAIKEAAEQKIATLEKVLQPGRDRLAAQHEFLSRRGLRYPATEHDSVVCALNGFVAAVTNAIAVATAIKAYAQANGERYAVRTFDQLVGELRAPLPVCPKV